MSVENPNLQMENEVASDGHKNYMNFHSDETKISKVAEWNREALENNLGKYLMFIDEMNENDVIESHKEKAMRNYGRLEFQKRYRMGEFDDIIEAKHAAEQLDEDDSTELSAE